MKICHIDKLEETFPSDCKIAILAISENVQETVDRLMKLGIKGIVDFTHSHFMVQEGVEVQTVDVVVAIQELVIKMNQMIKNRERKMFEFITVRELYELYINDRNQLDGIEIC